MKLKCLFCKSELPWIKKGGVYCTECKSAFTVKTKGSWVIEFWYEGNTHFSYDELIDLTRMKVSPL